MKLQSPLIMLAALLLTPDLHADETVSSSTAPLSKKERLTQCQSAIQAHFGSTAKCAKQICARCLVKKGKSEEDWQSSLLPQKKCLRKILRQTKVCKIVLSPKAFYDDFKNDPAQVDAKYKGKTVVIKGVLKEMAETPDGIPFANLKAGKYGIKRVILFASEQHQQKMLSYKKGATCLPYAGVGVTTSFIPG
ncbi:MAG: hypothetical protein GY845_04435 [Planctomycetes bacterium]|nr:hypothetical protein [Planctomycetota bacterium]